MKKTLIISVLLWGLACQAQEKPNFWHRPFWQKITIGTEFCHTVVPSYTYPHQGIFRNHPNNSANLMATYDLNNKWSIGAFVGYYGSEHVGGLLNSTYIPEDGYGISSVEYIQNTPTFSFGLEATLHILPLLYNQKTPFDLTLNGRAGMNPRDLDLGLGLGLGYRPWDRVTLYARAYYGAFGFPNGMQEHGLHCHLVGGISFRL